MDIANFQLALSSSLANQKGGDNTKHHDRGHNSPDEQVKNGPELFVFYRSHDATTPLGFANSSGVVRAGIVLGGADCWEPIVRCLRCAYRTSLPHSDEDEGKVDQPKTHANQMFILI